MMLPPRAYMFIGLNGVRILSIIALILVFASNIVTLVHDIKAVNKFLVEGRTVASSGHAPNATMEIMMNSDYILGSSVPNQPAGAFWAVLNRLFIIGQTVVLIFSEFGFPSAFFTRYFPVLGKNLGLGALGVIQMLIGAAVLSHHVDTFTLVSAFFLFSIGCLNVLMGLIFREGAKSKRSVTSWKDHAKSALPTHVGGVDIRPVVNMASSPPSFVSNMWPGKDEKPFDKAGFGFGRQGEKAAGMKGFLISKPIESLPRYAPKRTPTGNTEYSSTTTGA